MNKEELLKTELYKNAVKQLVVSLKEFHRYWYDLIVFPNAVADYFDSRELIREKLDSLKKQVAEKFDKHFVYFILSRKAVRFDMSFEPIISSNNVRIKILIGKDKKEKFLSVNFQNQFHRIELLDKYITIWESKWYKVTYTIHEFLDKFNFNLEIYNKVEYVGYTKNPDTRPTNGAHSGLSDILYKVPNDDNDFLIIFNVFETLIEGYNAEKEITFIVMNPLDARLEGELIEKCLICYFDSENQNRNKFKEETELKNSIIRENFSSITINYECELTNDYSFFYSKYRKPNQRHWFQVKVRNEVLEIDNLLQD